MTEIILGILSLSCLIFAGLALFMLWRKWPKSDVQLVREFTHAVFQAYQDGWDGRTRRDSLAGSTSVMDARDEEAAVETLAEQHARTFAENVRKRRAEPQTVMTLGNEPVEEERESA